MATITLIPSNYSSTNSSYSSVSGSYPISNGYTDTSSNTYAYITCKTGSNVSTYISYTFDTSSIPSNATINSVTAKAKVRVSSTSYISTGTIQLYNNATAMGSSTSARSTTATTYTISNPGTWTRSNIGNIQLRFTGTRGTRNTSRSAYLYFYGAEIEIDYTLPAHNITVTNNTSVTVTANPTSVPEGDSTVITASTISGIAITDNNVDVTNQFVFYSGTNGDYSTETRGSYGFALNNNGYYESQNKGVDKSCAVTRVSFNLPVSSTITIQYINYAEATYDFGVFGNLDVALTTNYYPAGSNGATITETSYKKACNTSSDNTSSVQTLTYSNVSAGDHFIDVKYSKDDASASNNDTLQFKITITYSQSVSYYTYTINNVTANHSIVVNNAGSNEKIYLKQNGSWIEAVTVYKKINGSWVEQSDATNVFDTSVNYIKGN